jgi:hypothetical protein
VSHSTWSSAAINADLPTPTSSTTVRRRLHDKFALSPQRRVSQTVLLFA